MANTVIGSSITIDGEISGDEDLVIQGTVKGKMLAKMKKEAVDCPVKLKKVSFVECFTCPNFNRRVRGKVGCKGLPLTPSSVQPPA